jgi:hypothetical protein
MEGGTVTKQQAISLKLAQWLVLEEARISGDTVLFWSPGRAYGDGWVKFDPFAPTTEGRAQFAECVIKAPQHFSLRFDSDAMQVSVWIECSVQKRWRWIHVNHSVGDAELQRATLEAIYYAIGGVGEDFHGDDNWQSDGPDMNEEGDK